MSTAMRTPSKVQMLRTPEGDGADKAAVPQGVYAGDEPCRLAPRARRVPSAAGGSQERSVQLRALPGALADARRRALRQGGLAAIAGARRRSGAHLPAHSREERELRRVA